MKHHFIILLCAGMLCACSSVMPNRLKEEAVEISFPQLIEQGQASIGQTVIVGGYVQKVENFEDNTRIEAVQSPLSYNQKPKSKDLSQGRLILTFPGFLDPEVYEEGRKITVGGRINGSSTTETNTKPYPYLHLRVESIHLWPVEVPVVYDPYPLMYDPWGYYYPWHPFPYRYYPYRYYYR